MMPFFRQRTQFLPESRCPFRELLLMDQAAVPGELLLMGRAGVHGPDCRPRGTAVHGPGRQPAAADAARLPGEQLRWDFCGIRNPVIPCSM